MTLTEYLTYPTHVRQIEDLWEAHTQRMAEYGFDRLVYGLTSYRTETSLGDRDDFVILTNHDPAYIDVFLEQGMYFHAPMTRWAINNDGAASWGMLAQRMQDGSLTPDEMQVLRFNKKHRVETGYSISFKSVCMRSKGAIALTARPGMSQDEVDAVWAEHGDDILLMNNVAHLKICTLPHQVTRRPLTPRQREALQWVGDGKTMQDTAVLMGLTQATVEKHLRLAREALGVETTAQAVLKASMQNQMFVLDA